jgi:hypothetical protein
MAQTVAGLTPLLKEVYHPKMRKVINEGDPTFTELKRRITSEEMDGSNYIWPLHTGRSSSGRFMAEQGTLPLASAQKGIRLSANAYQVAQTITITKKSKDRTKGKGAYVASLPFEVQGAVADMVNRLNRVSYGWGSAQGDTTLRTGKIARVQALPGGNVVTLGEDATHLTTIGEMRYFNVGDVTLVAINPATGAARANGAAGVVRNITAVNAAASQLTLDDVTNIAGGDILVEGDNLGNAYDLEYPGLRVLINDVTGDAGGVGNIQGATGPVTIHGQNSGTVPRWQSQVVSGPISDKLLQDSYTKIVTDGDGAKEGAPELVLGSWEQHDELANQLIALRRFDGREMNLQTGWKALVLSYGNYVPTRYCPTNDGFRINPQAMAWLVASDLDWDTDDGGEILLRSQSTLEYLARYVGDLGLVNMNRSSHVRLKFDALT